MMTADEASEAGLGFMRGCLFVLAFELACIGIVLAVYVIVL